MRVILNRLKSRANSNFLILVIKGTISSTLKFWIISKAFEAFEHSYYTLNDSIKLIKEHNRKIRIAASSEGGWLTIKNYGSDTVAVDLEPTIKGSALLKERL